MAITKILLRTIGLIGLVFGVAMIVSPSGNLAHMPLRWLAHAPTHSYLLPGFVILLGYGLIPLLLSRKNNFDRRRVLAYSLVAMCWIFFEAMAFQLFHSLHVVFLVLLLLVAVDALRIRDIHPLGTDSRDPLT